VKVLPRALPDLSRYDRTDHLAQEPIDRNLKLYPIPPLELGGLGSSRHKHQPTRIPHVVAIPHRAPREDIFLCEFIEAAKLGFEVHAFLIPLHNVKVKGVRTQSVCMIQVHIVGHDHVQTAEVLLGDLEGGVDGQTFLILTGKAGHVMPQLRDGWVGGISTCIERHEEGRGGPPTMPEAFDKTKDRAVALASIHGVEMILWAVRALRPPSMSGFDPQGADHTRKQRGYVRTHALPSPRDHSGRRAVMRAPSGARGAPDIQMIMQCAFIMWGEMMVRRSRFYDEGHEG